MAWKTWEDLSPEDKRVEIERQRAIVAQSSLERATSIVCCGSNSKSKPDVELVMSIAETLADFVFDYAQGKSPKTKDDCVDEEFVMPEQEEAKEDLPVPTPKQVQFISAIANQLDISVDLVYKDSLEVLGHYPSTKEEATELYSKLS